MTLSVRQARRLKDISMQEMADKLGLSLSAYIRKENGDVRFYIDEAEIFCNVTGQKIEDVNFFDRNVPQNGTKD